MTPHLQATLPAYAPHDLSQTLLYRVGKWGVSVNL